MALYFNVVCSGLGNGFHPRRGDMFIAPSATLLRLRSEERKDSGVVKLYLEAAPPNGVGTGFTLLSINISLLTE